MRHNLGLCLFLATALAISACSRNGSRHEAAPEDQPRLEPKHQPAPKAIAPEPTQPAEVDQRIREVCNSQHNWSWAMPAFPGLAVLAENHAPSCGKLEVRGLALNGRFIESAGACKIVLKEYRWNAQLAGKRADMAREWVLDGPMKDTWAVLSAPVAEFAVQNVRFHAPETSVNQLTCKVTAWFIEVLSADCDLKPVVAEFEVTVSEERGDEWRELQRLKPTPPPPPTQEEQLQLEWAEFPVQKVESPWTAIRNRFEAEKLRFSYIALPGTFGVWDWDGNFRALFIGEDFIAPENSWTEVCSRFAWAKASDMRRRAMAKAWIEAGLAKPGWYFDELPGTPMVLESTPDGTVLATADMYHSGEKARVKFKFSKTGEISSVVVPK